MWCRLKAPELEMTASGVRTLSSPSDISCGWDEDIDENDDDARLEKTLQDKPNWNVLPAAAHSVLDCPVSRVAASVTDVDCDSLLPSSFCSLCNSCPPAHSGRRSSIFDDFLLCRGALNMWAPLQPESLQLPGHSPTAWATTTLHWLWRPVCYPVVTSTWPRHPETLVDSLVLKLAHLS